MRVLTFVIAAVAIAAPALAQPPAPPAAPRPPPSPGPSMALALEAAQAAVATCTANGYKVGVTVIDSGGAIRVTLLGDGAAGGTGPASNRKAQASLKFKEPSAALQERAAKDQAFAAQMAATPELWARAGAQLITGKNGEVLGAMGVGGAPGGERDDVCTSAGLAKIKDRL